MLSFLFPKRNPQRADTAFSSLHESRTTIVSHSVTTLNFLYNYVCFHSHTLPPQPRSMPFPPTLVMSVQLPRRPGFVSLLQLSRGDYSRHLFVFWTSPASVMEQSRACPVFLCATSEVLSQCHQRPSHLPKPSLSSYLAHAFPGTLRKPAFVSLSFFVFYFIAKNI